MWQHIFILLVLFLVACSGETAVVPTPAPITVANAATVTEIGQGSYQSPYELLWNPDLNAFELPIEAMSLAFSPNGSLLATGDQDGTIMLWDVANQEEVATLTGHANMVQHLTFSQDGRLLASSGVDTVRILIFNTFPVTPSLTTPPCLYTNTSQFLPTILLFCLGPVTSIQTGAKTV